MHFISHDPIRTDRADKSYSNTGHGAARRHTYVRPAAMTCILPPRSDSLPSDTLQVGQYEKNVNQRNSSS